MEKHEDENRFDELIDINHNKNLGWSLEDCQDFVADARLKTLILKGSDFVLSEDSDAYIIRAADHAALDEEKSAHHRKVVRLDSAILEEIDRHISQDKFLVTLSDQLIVNQFLAAKSKRAYLLRRDAAGYTYKETTRKLGATSSEDSVRKATKRAVEKLKVLLSL